MALAINRSMRQLPLSRFDQSLTARRHKDLPLPTGSKTYTGDLTYYGPGMGACGVVSGDDDPIVAVSHYVFDAVQAGSNPNANPLCGRKIRAERNDNGAMKSVDLTVVDRCKLIAGIDL